MRAALFSFLTACCFFASPAVSAPPDIPVMVFAASSLTDAVSDIVAEFKKETGQQVYAHFAGSNALKRQIQKGMPADIFISADTRNIHDLMNDPQVRIVDTAVILKNHLVLLAHDRKEDAFLRLQDLPKRLAGRRLALADPMTVPAGQYAREALVAAGVWDQVRDRLAPTLDVRAALALVEGGHVPYAIVYHTDAMLARHSRVVMQVPLRLHQPIVYQMCLLQQGQDSETARRLFQLLRGEKSKDIFRKYGFE